MKNITLKQIFYEFIKKFVLVLILFFISLWVSNNNIYQGFIDYLWVLVLGALIISVLTVYFKPKIQNR
ncbi:hypothetical protein [Carnobacterium sp.]|uniref:hypothetical protein n=1 Tax=Carnobacterium sp. TaxID=48221 RepID=UPI00388ED6DB